VAAPAFRNIDSGFGDRPHGSIDVCGQGFGFRK
jgi:hypothetical protein